MGEFITITATMSWLVGWLVGCCQYKWSIGMTPVHFSFLYKREVK